MILFTGFEPFTTGQGLVLTHNPTADIAQRVAERLPNAQAVVLPVSYAETRRVLVEQLDTHRPAVWIGMGYAPHRETLDLEVLAVNMEHCEGVDNDGERPFMRAIVEGAPAAYETRVNVSDAVAFFAEHEVELTPSFHAGTFLCNQSFFVACHRLESVGDLRLAAFLHVPPMPSYDVLERALASWAEQLNSKR
jgi:pyroglutamyl-peptidase